MLGQGGRGLALLVLPQVSNATGQMNLTKVADSSPFALELLVSDDCFVLDNGLCGKIYIWKGQKANEKERQAALQVAEDFISRMRYPPNTQVRSHPSPDPSWGFSSGLLPSDRTGKMWTQSGTIRPPFQTLGQWEALLNPSKCTRT